MASTQLPPPTVGTPLHEWSEQTANAIGSPATQNVPASHNASANPADADPTQTAHPVVFDPAAKVTAAPPIATAGHAAPETPGPQVPGAFPRTLSDAGKPTLQQTFQQQAAPVIGSLQESLGKAAQSAAQYLPQSVKETVAPYLPEGTSVTANASHNDSVHKTSYPSTELTGAGTGEHVGGAGALPGRTGEDGIALLPDERLADQTGHAAPAPGFAQRAAGYLPQSVKDTVAPYLPASAVAATTASASEHDTTHTTSLPSTELTGAGTSEHVGGVGALPGRVNEAGITNLPDERSGADATHATTAASIGSTRDYVAGTAAVAAAAVARGTNQAKDTVTSSAYQAKDTVTSSAYQAKDTLNSGTNQAKDAVTSAPGAGALTTTSTAVAPHPTHSLPTTETEGNKPGEHVGGVGALPGGVGESGVAVLPGEKDVSSFPTREGDGIKSREHVGGAGSLPGAVGESGVALLPDEKNISSSHATAPKDIAPTTSGTSAPTGPTTGAPASIPVDEKKSDITSAKPHHEHEGAKAPEVKGDGYQTDYHPAALHPTNADYSGVQVGDGAGEKGAPTEKSAEGLGASKASANADTAQGGQPAGLKEGSDRKLHGGVPGDIGGGTMPVGDNHEGGIDSTDPKGKADTGDASPHKSKFMDKAKGLMHKIAHPKGDH